MFVTRRSKNSLFYVFDSFSNLDCGQWYKFWIWQSSNEFPGDTKCWNHGEERLFCMVTSVSIHSFVEWLDTFSYVLRPADVTVKEVNHIRCFAIDIAKDPVVLLWNTCACCNWRQHLQRLSPHGLHWPTVDEGLDTAALISVSFMLLGRRNLQWVVQGTTWSAFHFFQFLSNDDGQCLQILSKEGW